MLPLSQIVPYSALYIDMHYSYLFQTLWSYLRPVDHSYYLSLVSLLHPTDRTRLAPGTLQLPHHRHPLRSRLHRPPPSGQLSPFLPQALDWPPGTEVILTGVNIPDMTQVFRLHGLIPVPVEVDPHTLGCALTDV